MNIIKRSLIALFLVLPPAVNANDSYETFDACTNIYTLTTTAFRHKSNGVQQETLMAIFPPTPLEDQPEPLYSMRKIIEEVYSYDITNLEAYTAYRTERCVLRNAGQTKPINLSDILEELNICDSAKPECAVKLAHRYQ